MLTPLATRSPDGLRERRAGSSCCRDVGGSSPAEADVAVAVAAVAERGRGVLMPVTVLCKEVAALVAAAPPAVSTTGVSCWCALRMAVDWSLLKIPAGVEGWEEVTQMLDVVVVVELMS